MALTFDGLPLEIVALIAEPLADERTALLNLALTSSRYQAVAESLLWRRLFIQTGQQCRRVLHSLRSRPERATATHEIELRATYRHELGLQKFPKILGLAHNLRDLTIESPTCNYRQWDGDANWPDIKRRIEALLRHSAGVAIPLKPQEPPLQLLKRLVIHSNGSNSRFWDISVAFDGIFHHPCLEEVTLSCANINVSCGREPARKATALKSLTLVECNINLVGLRGMLSCPRALEQLYLGEIRDHEQEQRATSCSDLLAADAEQFFAALRQQAHSLKAMTYRPRTPELLNSFSGKETFEDFSQLGNFVIDGQLGTSDVLEGSLLRTAPHLETLVVTHHEGGRWDTPAVPDGSPHSNSPLYHLTKRALAGNTLKQLHIVVSSRLSLTYFRSESVMVVLDRCTKLLRSRKIRLVLFEERQRFGLVPPYLYGEEPPSQRTIFDSETGGWEVGLEDTGSAFDDHYVLIA